jgi:hypothetical protein
MMALEFFRWWYGHGWALALTRIQRKLRGIEQAFSVGILLRTLFEPWRRTITYPGASLNDHIQAIIDNLVSRFIGFMVRISVLLAATFTALVFGLLALVGCIVWPVVPLAAMASIAWGLLL